MKIRELTKPLRRRVGNLVLEMSPAGLAVRGKRKRTWRRASWKEVAALFADQRPMVDEPIGEQLIFKLSTPKPKRRPDATGTAG